MLSITFWLVFFFSWSSWCKRGFWKFPPKKIKFSQICPHNTHFSTKSNKIPKKSYLILYIWNCFHIYSCCNSHSLAFHGCVWTFCRVFFPKLLILKQQTNLHVMELKSIYEGMLFLCLVFFWVCLFFSDLPNHGASCYKLGIIGKLSINRDALSWFHNVSTYDGEVIE